MGISVLKKMNENLPDGIKILCAPIIRRSLIKNTIFLNQYEELVHADKDEEYAKRCWQNKMKELLIFAYENTTYYHRVFDENSFSPYAPFDSAAFQRIPLLTRNYLEEHIEELTAPVITNYYAVTTGGSTGRPLHIELESESIYREKAFIYHFWSKYGYDYKNSRIVTFRGIHFGNKISKVNPLYNELLLNPFLLSRDTIHKYVEKIEKFGVQFLQGYPSSIYSYCMLLEHLQIKLTRPIKAVFCISENVLPEQKEYIEKVLKCPVIAFYGHSERSVFAEQEEDGCYCFNSQYGYTELSEKEEGFVICTGFLNRRIPLIRYKLDDYAKNLHEGKVVIVGHHDSDVLLGTRGERISMSAINFHDKTFEQVAAYQFEQWKVGEATLYIIPKPGVKLNNKILSGIKIGIEGKLQHIIAINVEILDAPKLTERGKYKMMIQHCKV